MSQPPESWPVPQGDPVKDWLDANFSAYFESSPAQIQVNRVLGLTQSTVTGSVPAGAMMDYGAAVAPAGWVLCDGATYDGTTATYAALWAVIGTTFGGTGQSAFKVPDSCGRVSVGYAASGGHVDVSTIGLNDGVAKANRRSKHNSTNGLTVSLTDPGHTHGFSINVQSFVSGSSIALRDDTGTTGPTGFTTASAPTGITGSLSGTIGPGGTAATDTPAYIVLPKIIKL